MSLSKTVNVLRGSARFRNMKVEHVGDGNVNISMDFKFQPLRGSTRFGVYDGIPTVSYYIAFAFCEATNFANWTEHYEKFDVQMLGYSDWQTFSKSLNIGYMLDESRIEEKTFFTQVKFYEGYEGGWEYSDAVFSPFKVKYQPELDTSIDGEDGMFDMIQQDELNTSYTGSYANGGRDIKFRLKPYYGEFTWKPRITIKFKDKDGVERTQVHNATFVHDDNIRNLLYVMKRNPSLAFRETTATFWCLDSDAYAHYSFNDAQNGISVSNVPMQYSEQVMGSSDVVMNDEIDDFAYYKIVMPEFDDSQNPGIKTQDGSASVPTDDWEEFFPTSSSNATTTDLEVTLELIIT